MTYAGFMALVRSMRASQKKYFNQRHQTTLAEAKDWERRVDAALAEMDANPDLFFGPELGVCSLCGQVVRTEAKP